MSYFPEFTSYILYQIVSLQQATNKKMGQVSKVYLFQVWRFSVQGFR